MVFFIIYTIGALIGAGFGLYVTDGDPEFDRSGKLFPEKCPVWFMVVMCGVIWWIILIWITVVLISKCFRRILED